MAAKARVNNQNVLRAIGQGLETLEVIAFDLQVSDNQYEVRGEARKLKTAAASKPSLKRSFLNLILHGAHKRTAKTTGLRHFHFAGLRFTAKDIDLLERKGQVLQSNFETSAPNPHSLSQILRTVGAYLDLHECQLEKISWRDGLLTLWYLNRRGVESKDILSRAALHDQWAHQYKQRKPMQLLKRTGND
ncbi:MAG: hypothetical protein ACREPG_06190 [Candidatus Binatia bacterium]